MGCKRTSVREGLSTTARLGDEGRDSLWGFTLAEVMVSAVVVGVGISAALFGLGTSAANSGEGQNVLTAQALSAGIFDYSQGLAFSEPGGGDVFGPEPGENGLEDFDDVNDLDGLILSPPRRSRWRAPGRLRRLVPGHPRPRPRSRDFRAAGEPR